MRFHPLRCCLALLVLIGCGASDEAAPDPTVLITPVGTPSGAPVMQSIGPAGGTIASADGRLTITFPAGALATATSISIQPITNESPGGAGAAYRLGPEGQTFAAPVRLAFRYVAADLRMSEPSTMRVAFQAGDGSWRFVRGFVGDPSAATITGETTHFSDWTMLTGRSLKPGSAIVALGGAQVLDVVFCVEDPACGVELPCPALCYQNGLGDTLEGRKWRVNGQDLGDTEAGFVTETSPGSARYTAPNATPAVNPVAVSLEATCPLCLEADGGSVFLVSNLTVGGHPPYSGTITSTVRQTDAGGTATWSVQASVTLIYDEAQGMYRPSTGTISATYDHILTTCENHGTYDGPIGPQDGGVQLFEGEGTYFPFGQDVDATYTGTSSCNAQMIPMPAMFMAGAPWWAPPSASPFMFKMPDERMEENVTSAQTGFGDGEVQWLLTVTN